LDNINEDMKMKRVIIFLPWLRTEKSINICEINYVPLKTAYEKVRNNINLIRQYFRIVFINSACCMLAGMLNVL